LSEKYLAYFTKLRTDKNRKHWSAVAHHQAPHKPFLLLSIMDLVALGAITDNIVQPTLELLDTFNRYFSNLMPIGARGIMAYPFYHMRSEPFWSLIPNEGFTDKPGRTISSMTKLNQIYFGAKIDEDLFGLMTHMNSRESLRHVLVITYFTPEVQPAVLQQGAVNLQAYEYSQKLLELAEKRKAFDPQTVSREPEKRVRDQGFRKVIVDLYHHRCALCGIRMLTPEGHTVVEAAHVVPWSKSQDDRPTNGMSLCRLCHWPFDQGLMSVGKSYEVLVSKRVQLENNIPAHILPLADRKIFTPEKEQFWPAQENLQWHSKRIFTQ
jgi:putative restriction endonuclease